MNEVFDIGQLEAYLKFFVIVSSTKNEDVTGTSRKDDLDNLIIFNPFKDDWNTRGKFSVMVRE